MIKTSKKREKIQNKPKDIIKLEDELSYEVEYSDLPPDDIVSYNELRSCADLFRLYKNGTLDIQPDFQREIVWNPAMQTRFIDSLTKQLPIPSMCLSLDYKTQKWMVIDGLQRMWTIIRFFSEDEWVLSNLSDIRKEIAGKKVKEIRSTHSILYSRVQNDALPVNILRCDYNKKDHAEYIFTIFHRLNAGGMRLNNQEIRNAVYHGPFNELLKDCDNFVIWRKLLGVKEGEPDRFRRIELILRFFTFLFRRSQYNGKLASFLNEYMHDNRNIIEKEALEKKKVFQDVIELIYDKISNNQPLQKLRPKIGNTIIEALMIGVASNLKSLSKKDNSVIRTGFSKMLSRPEFSEDNLMEGTLKREKVVNRLDAAISTFKTLS